jgi:hypothetical protein
MGREQYHDATAHPSGLRGLAPGRLWTTPRYPVDQHDHRPLTGHPVAHIVAVDTGGA